MIIDSLPVLSSPVNTDEIAIERGTVTYKATLGNLTNGIGAAVRVYFTGSGIYAALQSLPVGQTATFYADGSAADVLTGGNYASGSLKGTVTNIGSGVYDFLAFNGTGANYGALATWRMEGLTSSSATPTVTYFTKYYNKPTIVSGTASVTSLATQDFQTVNLTFAEQPDTNYMLLTESSVAGLVTSVRDKTTTGCTLVIGNMRNTALTGVVTWALVRL